ncbi:Peptidase M23 [Candidatus Sulfotelmatomonas gaucii]|uniref:Peptidase M23 n=1 Tax=Candidatus Sulfuritelmatomonas gaucii TaxID=2043161 RepID=A0A2N9LNY4_9BACT|nr:Peptidase M23 [Candidatus Sulfotelmatomonas gaucii]
MLRKRYYILFVARDEDGQLRKISLPLKYAYAFVAAAIVGAFTIVGLAGSYTRMLLKTESYNQVRAERETLRQNYQRMAEIAHNRGVQVASLGALANEVTALYGLRQNRLEAAKTPAQATAAAAAAITPATLMQTDDPSQQQVTNSIDAFYALRQEAMSGAVSRALESGLTPNFNGDWTELADAPSMWPLEGRVASSFGEREDPINGEGAFHTGIDIDAPYGTPVRAAADGDVSGASMGAGYGREVVLDHGHEVRTVYGHLSAIAVVPGQRVTRGQVIGYVGESGRATGPHLHYEVRVHNVPVNPYKYLHVTYEQAANLDQGSASGQ